MEIREIEQWENPECKCKYGYWCPLARKCDSQSKMPSDIRTCHGLICEDIDCTRQIIQDMTTRMSSAIYISGKLNELIDRIDID